MPLTGEYAPSTSDWARKQAELYESSGGTEGTSLNGMPVIVVTSVGAKSGKLRKTPLMRVEHNGEYAAVASLGGAPKHPVWYYNLKKNPHVELQDETVKKDYIAREVTGDEKAAWWERAVAAYPPYADYQQKTLVAQLAQAVFGNFHLGFVLITAVTALILVLAANTAFNGFPVLGSILAQDSYLPRQLHTRGDRLALAPWIIWTSCSDIWPASSSMSTAAPASKA
mgnify:CR=1 FL=1